MKIGAGGLHAQAVQDIISSRLAEQAKIKSPVDEETVKGQQKYVPDLNKPVVNTNKSAELNAYLVYKENGILEKKKTGENKKVNKKEKDKEAKHVSEQKNYTAKGFIVDEYK